MILGIHHPPSMVHPHGPMVHPHGPPMFHHHMMGGMEGGMLMFIVLLHTIVDFSTLFPF